MGEEESCVQEENCWMCSQGETFEGIALVAKSASLDLALIRLEGNPGDKYGWLELDNRIPPSGTPVFIPQHPGGRAKEIALKDTSSDGAECEILEAAETSCSSSAFGDLRYKCDTEGGASGSPVIARDTNKVIALHHCGGGCRGNKGVPAHVSVSYTHLTLPTTPYV